MATFTTLLIDIMLKNWSLVCNNTVGTKNENIFLNSNFYWLIMNENINTYYIIILFLQWCVCS